MLAQPLHNISRLINHLRTRPLQSYVNTVIVSMGLGADLIALGTFFGAIHTPPSGSNYYVNSREFLSWMLLALVYSIGFINAYFRRRWRRKYGVRRADHSVWNIFFLIPEYFLGPLHNPIGARNFKRDFSILYVFLLPITFLFNRAIAANENATAVTPSPWGDLVIAVFLNGFVSLGMMVVTSMFDFAMPIFAGDQVPE